MSSTASTYLSEQQKKAGGDIATEWCTIEDLYNRKLWHQLTLRLLTFVKDPYFQKGDALLQMYNNFLSDFEHRINQLALVELILFVVAQIQDPTEAITFLEKIQEKVKNNKEACILCLTAIGMVKIKQRDLEGTKSILEKAQVELDDLDGITTVHARFYELSSNYHKLMGNHADYYREALRYLGCLDLSTLPAPEQVERAYNIGLAGVLGKGVYNFGELLAHPILESLKNSDKSWLVDLLLAFNCGNLTKFNNLRPRWVVQPDLAAKELELRQKICLLCLMEMTFKRPANHRQLSFKEIATETQLPLEEVELLVMKALSLGLVKGSIDQVEERVHMTWVQPRVLDREQVGTMQQRLQEWCESVKNMELLVEGKAQDILT